MPDLPDDINFTGEQNETLLPTFKGQIIQVTRVHSNNEWCFGNVLYDPILDNAMTQTGDNEEASHRVQQILAQVLHDRPTSGWFPKAVVKTAGLNVMDRIADKMGTDNLGLSAPTHWTSQGHTRVKLARAEAEFQTVNDYFLRALYGQKPHYEVVSVYRVENLPLYQSYTVKLKTMQNSKSQRVNNNGDVERRWLFHGTRKEVIDKIVQQGFNRSFAGFNAVAYGKGTYLARDSSYSCHPTYSVPDDHGIQYMFLVRAIVGDWARGRHGQVAPDPKPNSALEIFDTTVDNVSNPSIFVAYHDSQIYPEYLVAFRRTARSIHTSI